MYQYFYKTASYICETIIMVEYTFPDQYVVTDD